MKRLIIAVSMLSAAIIFCVAEKFIISDATDELCSAFEECLVKEKNEKLYRVKVEKAVALLEEKKTVLYIFIPRNELDELENNADELRFFVKNSDYNECFKVCFLAFENLKRINDDFS